MRLRLTIQRNKLPTADLLWVVPEDNAHKGFTISKLLEQISEVFPLETDHWGLDDYIVELGNFECLHFQKVAEILKDEDQVCIRPLTTNELRARHLSGRSQINANGQHLLDGVPFGRSRWNMRRLDRPNLHIPPDTTTTTDLNNALVEQYRQHQQSSQHDEEEEEDSDYVPERPARKRQRIESSSEKSVRFEDEEATAIDNRALIQLPSDDDTSEEEFVPDADDLSDDGSASTISESSSESSSEDRSVAVEDEEAGKSSEASDSSSDLSSEPSDSSSESSDTSESDSSDSDESSSESEPEEMSSKENASLTPRIQQRPMDRAPPGKGKAVTHSRNRRRREAIRLKYLKAQGILPPGATLADMRERDGAHSDNYELEDALMDNGVADNGMVDTSTADTGVTDTAEAAIERKRQQLLAALASGGLEIDPRHPDEIRPVNKTNEPVIPTPPETTLATEPSTSEMNEQNAEGAKAESAPKRSRLDVGSTRRMLFGALGVRNPKTKADEDKLRNKFMTNVNTGGRKKASVKQKVEEDEEEELDPELWKKKVNLLAFECKLPGIELSTPPFPFKQRWDPQTRQDNKKNKKRKRTSKKQQEYEYDEEAYYDYKNGTYDENSGYYDDEWAELNYDDAEQAETSNIYQEEDEAVQSQLLQDVQGPDSKTASVDLPSPPSDINTLPDASMDHVRPGAIIVFKRLEVSQETGWAPKLSDVRTAKVEEVDDTDVKLSLALRDRSKREIKFDDHGKRLYEKFEMDLAEENDEEDGVLWVDFAELIEPKLLYATPEDARDGVVDEDQGEPELGAELDSDTVDADVQDKVNGHADIDVQH